jgi:hypothetical protein
LTLSNKAIAVAPANKVAVATDAIPAELANIEAAERKLERGRERLANSENRLRRLTEDASIFGKTVDVDEREALEFEAASDEQLVVKLTRELEQARNAPELRRAKDARGNELLSRARELDASIAAKIRDLAPDLTEAQKVLDEIVRDYNKHGGEWVIFTEPFANSKVLPRLRFWLKPTPNAIPFKDLLARYLALPAGE